MNNDFAFGFLWGLAAVGGIYGATCWASLVYRKIRERYRLSPGVEMLIESGQITKRPESRTVDSSFLAHVARQIDGSKAPDEVKNNSNQAYFKGGPLDGSFGLYPPVVELCRYFLIPVHRRQDRFAVYCRTDETEDWSGDRVTKVWEFTFERYANKAETEEIFRKMAIEDFTNGE